MRYLIVLLLAGCASDMVKVAEPTSVAVYWFRVNPVCGLAEHGCTSSVDAAPDFSMCRITAPETVDDAMLGQQFRRCFGFVVSGRATRAPTATLTASDLVKVAEPKSVVVTWTREAPTRITCRNERVRFDLRGCAIWARDYSRCRIIADEFIYDSTLGHELRHCFGWQHEADIKWRAGPK